MRKNIWFSKYQQEIMRGIKQFTDNVKETDSEIIRKSMEYYLQYLKDNKMEKVNDEK